MKKIGIFLRVGSYELRGSSGGEILKITNHIYLSRIREKQKN